MKTFSLIDANKPMQFYTNCSGCVLEPKKMDQVMIVTENGSHVQAGIQLPHDLSVRLYAKILEAAKIGGVIEIPDMYEMDDDQIRIAIDNIKIAAN